MGRISAIFWMRRAAFFAGLGDHVEASRCERLAWAAYDRGDDGKALPRPSVYRGDALRNGVRDMRGEIVHF